MIFTLPHIVRESAARFPEHEAFRFMDESLSYATLVQRANNLALALRDLGVKRGDRVGIYQHKSLETPVAVYGVMTAGAVYVPLDPMMPVTRLAYIIRDCGIRHLISDETKRNKLQQLAMEETAIETIIGPGPAPIVPFHILSWNEVNSIAASAPPPVRTIEQDMAYIMYTSGSTGEPKGIIHTHHSGLSYAKQSADTYALQPDDRLANFAPLHFDQSTFDYFSGPLAGATTVIIPDAYTKLPASLSKLIADEQVSIWYSVPFALVQLLLHGVLESRDLRALRWVLFGGEPFPIKHLRSLMNILPQARFSNIYGPAEVNQCTYFHVPPLPEGSDEPIPIGQIWDNAEGLIIGDDDEPVASGNIGELVVRTPTMMSGYWGRRDLNDQAYYHRAGTDECRDVFYRTGDLVQLAADGNLKFMGRKDRQIKTRGYRVELDEVEAIILSHEEVEETAVFPIPDTNGSQQIAAAVMCKKGASTTTTQLTVHANERLPGYAVPTQIKIMNQFPRTSNGKINRRELQARWNEG